MSHHDSRPDPVDELFARERAAVTTLGADDLRWRTIARRARAARRARRLRYAGAAAAVALLAAGVTWVGTGGHGGPAPAATQTGHGTATPGPVPSTGPARLPSSPTSATGGVVGYGSPVPRDFTVLSMSNVGHGTLFAMGAGDCGGTRGRCPLLVRSTDDGRTWSTVHAFIGQAVPSRDHQAMPVQPVSVLTQVRFANPRVGWVFGGGAFETRDGGRTWRQWSTGGAVQALETDGTRVVALSGSQCDGGSCSGPFASSGPPGTSCQVNMCSKTIAIVAWTVEPPADSSAPGILHPLSDLYHAQYLGGRVLGSSWSDPTLAIVGGRPLFAVRTGAGGLVLYPDPKVTLVAALAPAACRDGGPEVIAADASPQHQLVGLCATGGAAGSLGYAVSTSSDGTTWAPVSADALVLVNAGHVSLAAVDRSNLLAVSGGSPDVHGAMQVSHDGGRTWATPVGAPPMPATGWRWVGAPGGSTYYALAGDGSQYWVSDDRGDHWHRVNIR